LLCENDSDEDRISNMKFNHEPVILENKNRESEKQEDYLTHFPGDEKRGGSKKRSCLINDSNKTRHAKIEALISEWRIGSKGELKKIRENRFTYNSEYQPSAHS